MKPKVSDVFIRLQGVVTTAFLALLINKKRRPLKAAFYISEAQKNKGTGYYRSPYP
jgi:hypothetical protein